MPAPFLNDGCLHTFLGGGSTANLGQKAMRDAVNAATPVRKFVAAPAAQHRACIGATDALLMPLVNTLVGDKVVHRHFAPRERTFCRAPTSSINHLSSAWPRNARRQHTGRRLSDGLLPCALYLFQGNRLA
jgi:hypothetical protein